MQHKRLDGEATRLELDAYHRTGGHSSLESAMFQMTISAHLVEAWAGGPIDAPSDVPAGSCNSTTVRVGPWGGNGGKGHAVPAVSYVARG